MVSRHSLTLPGVFGCAALVTSCASIWGFQDAQDLAGGDGGLGSGGEGGSVVEPSGTPGVLCVPAAPVGFQGPLAIYEGSTTSQPTPPPCPDAFTPLLELDTAPVTTAGTCTCRCAAPTGVTCGEPTATFHSDAACATAPCGLSQTVPTIVGSVCQPFTAGGCIGQRYIKVSVPPMKGGSCVASKVDGTDPPPFAWQGNARLCTPPPEAEARCAAGKVAVPATLLPYRPSVYCVVAPGAATCPDTFPSPHTYFDKQSYADSRACQPCQCGSAKGSCAGGGSVETVDTASNCSGGTSMHTVPGTCSSFANSNTSFGYMPPTAPSFTATCDPIGGGPTGEVTTSNPVTVCCTQ